MTKNKICVGTGLISLDILMHGNERQAIRYSVGGTCGNVLMILSYWGWSVYPIARLGETNHAKAIIDDMKKNNVHTTFVSTNDGYTPIIIQQNIIDALGNHYHKFKIHKNQGRYFLGYKSITINQAREIIEKIDFVPYVFFFDRVSPAAVYMAKHFKAIGTLIYFEPSCNVENDKFAECVELSDIIKFAEQRIQDVSFTANYRNKLFIQTLGHKGLRYSLHNEHWIYLDAIKNPKVVDTSGAGDWTTASFIDGLIKSDYKKVSDMTSTNIKKLLIEAQKMGSSSCSYEGARGMMKNAFISRFSDRLHRSKQ